ncbi:hypothetical protein AVEN_110777-1 [Araneus ventricosus]|uniref:Uncharacterized protein n=1 Tax=Araneus ventricosus TaxID=182803 RepID=A0A4Y2L093_ARAVE|nr:hypothetical protein AVEN_110777-1 [Araneus ventricosus]
MELCRFPTVTIPKYGRSLLATTKRNFATVASIHRSKILRESMRRLTETVVYTIVILSDVFQTRRLNVIIVQSMKGLVQRTYKMGNSRHEHSILANRDFSYIVTRIVYSYGEQQGPVQAVFKDHLTQISRNSWDISLEGRQS